MDQPRLQPAIDQRLLRPYTSHRPRVPIDLFLDANEGSTPPPQLLASLRTMEPELLRRYPNAEQVESRIAATLGVDPACVVFTAGGDDAIDRCFRAMIAPGDEVILPVPTFEMIARYAALRGASIAEIHWGRGPFPTSEILSRIDQRTRVIAVVTPNNPTGSVASAADIAALATAAPHALLLVDLAYTEFADDDLTPIALSHPNAVVIRTFSKAFGLAGLRAGFAAGNAEVVRWLRSVGNPYAASAITVHLAHRCVDLGPDFVRPCLDLVRSERSDLVRFLTQLGERPYPSQANFVLCQFGDAAGVHRALAERGIAVRAFPGHPLLADCLRITCPGEPSASARLKKALEEILNR